MGAKTYRLRLDPAGFFGSDGPRMPVGRVLLAICISLLLVSCKKSSEDEFIRLTNVGRNYYSSGPATKALGPLQQALAKNPANADAHLNVAVAALAANEPELAIKHAQEVLNVDHNSGGAYYILGSAYLRIGRAKEAVQALQQAKDIDRTVNAVSFQLGRAYQQLNQFPEAREQFAEVTQFETNHPAAYYNLSQVLIRLGQTDEAQKALAEHQKINANRAGQITDPSVFERCQYTQIRAPFRLEQPDARGIQVAFTEVPSAIPAGFQGPFGVIDFNHDGRPSLVAIQSNTFRVLFNSNGVFRAAETALPAEGKYSRCLIGDLNNDKVEDAIFLGDKGAHVLKFTTNGSATDVSAFSKLAGVQAVGGELVDLDFTGKLDLLAITGATNGVKLLRNFGHPYFSDNTTNSGLPLTLTGAEQLLVEDWNNDELLDLFITRSNQPPLLLLKERGGALMETNLTADWPVASLIAAGDLNNDLRFDVVMVAGDKLVCIFSQLKERQTISVGHMRIRELSLVDYDNDGWLDIIAAGDGIRVWRNLGASGFKEVQLGLDKIGSVASFRAFDFDGDCDSDLVVALDNGSLRCFRNDGGNANAQLKPHLMGTKSNASALGIRVDVAAAGLRITRRVQELPVEIGIGRHQQIDSVTAHWLDVNLNYTDVKVDCRMLLAMDELAIPTGSCPYLYAWDGKQFRFVTDMLGAAPAGLPISETRFIDADPDEYVWIGDDSMFPACDGNHVLQITEELREILYLDQAKLVVVDHPPGTEVHTTGKLLPGPPFPKHEIVTLHKERPLLNAISAGKDVTASLQRADGKMVSPEKLRIPQLRGLAEPHSVTLDFGPLPIEKRLVLAITAWLRFGGGMANIGASHNPDLPFPFPILEAEVNGRWKTVDVNFGAPVGKTKRMIVDLTGKLPQGARRLRITTAFEIHWDRIALLEKRDNSETRITFVAPSKTDLHWRGFSEHEALPWHQPLTPNYNEVSPQAKWTITPAGWCTRYGPVDELIAERDNGLALLNGGDELTLSFDAAQIPPKQALRDFFLFAVGWDKDADFHCTRGWEVEPLPWDGMDSQKYGYEIRPSFTSDKLMERYNTRWVGPRTLTRK